jgi:hypothetical protein
VSEGGRKDVSVGRTATNSRISNAWIISLTHRKFFRHVDSAGGAAELHEDTRIFVGWRHGFRVCGLLSYSKQVGKL